MTATVHCQVRIALLRDVVEFDRDAVQPEAIESGTYYLGLEHLSGEGKILKRVNLTAGDLASTKFRFTPEHVLYGKLRPYLRKVVRPDFVGICSTDIIPMRPGPDVDRDYLYHWLRTPEIVALADSRSSGANLPRISPTVMGEFEIPLPPLPEQKRIAVVLDKAFEIQHKSARISEDGDRMARSIFDHRFKPWINEKSSRAFIELCDPLVDCRNKTAPYEEAGIPLIRTSNFRNCRLDLETTVYVSEATNKIWSARYRPSPGDIVYCREAPFGMAAMIPNDTYPCLGQRIMVAHANVSVVRPLYLLYALNSSFVRRQADQCAVGATVRHLRVKDVEELRIPVPPLAVQEVFENLIVKLGSITTKVERLAASAAAMCGTLRQLCFKV